MQFLEEIKKLPESLHEDLDHLVESRLIELGFLKDPYGFDESQRLALDAELMNIDTEAGAEEAIEQGAVTEEELSERAEEIPAYLIEWLENTNDGTQLQAIYQLTRNAVSKAENRYNGNIPSGDEWKKLFGI